LEGSTLNQAGSDVGRKPLRERTRRPDDALSHAVNHWIRVEALAILHEGEFSAGEVAEMIGEDVKNVRGHIRDLYDSGSIEFAGYKVAGNFRKPVYRAIVLPFVSPEAYRGMSIADRHDLNGAVVQGILAESVSSYRAGKMDTDEDLYLVWDAPNLDAQGEEELHDHLEATFEGVKAIHARSANRMAETGEAGATKVVSLMSFKRGRQGRPKGGYYGSGKNDR
jgi:DNA-binding transcriptional ArsR family regulator